MKTAIISLPAILQDNPETECTDCTVGEYDSAKHRTLNKTAI